jgi:hypothetical protein
MTVNEAIAALIALRDAAPDNGALELDVEYCEPHYSGPAERVEIYNAGTKRRRSLRARITYTGL